MNGKWILFSVCIQCVYSFVILGETRDKNDTDCCIREEWQGLIFLDLGMVFIDQNTLYTYYNGTLHVAYSVPKQKFYYSAHVVEQSPLIPQPVTANSTVLKDYSLGISYTVDGGSCQKDKIDKSMPKQCIPVNAKMLSSGGFGDGKRVIETYEFMTGDQDLPFQVTATVLKDALGPRECEPFHATYFTPSLETGSGTMYTLNVMDAQPLTSEHVFDVPKECIGLN